MMNNKKKAPIMRRALYYYSKGAEWFRVFAPDTHHVSGPSVWRWEWQEEGMASAPGERGDRPGTGCFSKRCRNLCSRIVVGAVGDPEPAPRLTKELAVWTRKHWHSSQGEWHLQRARGGRDEDLGVGGGVVSWRTAGAEKLEVIRKDLVSQAKDCELFS